MIGRVLDLIETTMAQQSGAMVYYRGSLSPLGSIFNAVVSGIILVGGVTAAVTEFQPFFIGFIAIGATLHTLFVLIAVRVHTGRTLFDRDLTAELDEEESGGTDE